jgi:hypothetical protein
VKKTHHQTERTSLPKAKRRFSLIKHPFLALAGTWIFFALLAAISLEVTIHPNGERRVTVETPVAGTLSEPAHNQESKLPLGLYGAIALICTGGSILVYRRYQRKLATSDLLQVSQTQSKARKRRTPRQPQPTVAPVMDRATNVAPAPQKTRSRRRKPERVPVTSNSYTPRPLERQAPVAHTPEVTVLPPPRRKSGKSKGLVEAMDVRNQKSLNSLLGDREIS